MVDWLLQGTINEPQSCSHPQATISDSHETKADTVMERMDFSRNLK